MITPDSSNRENELLLARLLTDDHSDFPVQAPGLVRTLIMQEGWYSLDEDRNKSLCDYSLARNQPAFLMKELVARGIYERPVGREYEVTTVEESLRLMRLTEAELDEEGISMRTMDHQWWLGSWSAEERPENYFESTDPANELLLLEHVLLDGAGAWAIIISDEAHAFLIGDKATSRELLKVWKTTPEKELAAFEEFWRFGPDPYQRRVLAHARAGAWA